MQPYIAGDRCDTCGECLDNCPNEVFQKEGDGTIVAANAEDCIECGGCVASCPQGAIILGD